MAKGIAAFAHDADASEKTTVKVLKGVFGNDGYAFWFITLERMAMSENMQLNLKKRTEWLKHVAICGVSEEKAKGIIAVLCDLKAIDADLWSSKKIIWSDAFVERAKTKLSRRHDGVPDKPEVAIKDTQDGCADGFERFWSHYPRKIGKGEAHKKYKTRLKEGYSEEELTQAAIEYARQCAVQRTETQYIKHARTFLSDSLPFLDYLPSGAASNVSASDNPFGAFEISEEYRRASNG